MAVNPLLDSISTILAQQSVPVPIRTSASPVTVPDGVAQTGDTFSNTLPPQALLQNVGLLNASSNFAQLSSLLEVAQSGTEQVGAIIEQLQSLAKQAAGGGDLGNLDSAFQQLLTQLDQAANGTTFGGASLLNGTFSADAAASGQGIPAFSLPALSVSALFSGASPDVSTAQNASSALAALLGAQDSTSSASTQITGLLGQVSFASASINSALSNSTAAASTLSESDLASGAISDIFAGFLSKPAAAAQTQTGKLTDNLLSLLQE